MTAKSVPRDERWWKKISINLKVVINSNAFRGFELLSLVRPGRIHPTTRDLAMKKNSQFIFSFEYFHFRNRELIFVPRTRKLDLIRKSLICSSNIGFQVGCVIVHSTELFISVTEETEGVCIKTPENDPLNWRSQGRSYIAYKLDWKGPPSILEKINQLDSTQKEGKSLLLKCCNLVPKALLGGEKLWERGWNFCCNPISC